MAEALYIKLEWIEDDQDRMWCHATVVLNGNPLIQRSARLEKNGTMAEPDTVRQTAVSLAKFELCRWLTDYRGPRVPGLPEEAG